MEIASDTHAIEQLFRQLKISEFLSKWSAQCDWVGIHLVDESTQYRSIRNERPEHNMTKRELGLMLEVLVNGQFAYSGTCDLTSQGLSDAFAVALSQGKISSKQKSFQFSTSQRVNSKGEYNSAPNVQFDQTSLAEITDFLLRSNKRLKVSDQIVNADSTLMLTTRTHRQVSSSGMDVIQKFHLVSSNFGVVAQSGSETQRRSLNGPVARCYQGGLERVINDQWLDDCELAGRQAIQLLQAENCPSEKMDLLLSPDQMYIQIHESIGHPLEYDRILGDERNYAGWSFVTPADFGKLQYGSKLLNVVFDPQLPSEFASYAFDDCGNPAKKEYLIKNGLLVRGLGSLESQSRINLDGVANFRSASWNRAPIDRMANINIEPGDQSIEDMISSVERGIFMQSNISWSIDDYRNKFQFGCEFAQLIENGKITKVVKNPNYRGISVPFWNSLKAVGSAKEFKVFGSPYCGKGEPSQVIRVGHASPPCLFSQIEVFGGGK